MPEGWNGSDESVDEYTPGPEEGSRSPPRPMHVPCDFCGTIVSKKSIKKHKESQRCHILRQTEEARMPDGLNGNDESVDEYTPGPEEGSRSPPRPMHISCDLCGTIVSKKSIKKHKDSQRCHILRQTDLPSPARKEACTLGNKRGPSTGASNATLSKKPRKKNTSDIDKLLRLPERPADGGKTNEERLDELDAEIAARDKKHKEEMAKTDMETEGVRRKEKERQARLRANALLGNRLKSELTEERLRGLFKENLAHLHGIWAGTVFSWRHIAFNKSVSDRQGLFYTMITKPFTDEQLDWTLEEMSAVWMRNKREYMDNNQYVWRVLMPECFIKFYMDLFSMGKSEAEKRIAETPLRPEDDWDSS
jgi:hypothetical protein